MSRIIHKGQPPHVCELFHAIKGTIWECDCGQIWMAIDMPPPGRGTYKAGRGWYMPGVPWGWRRISRRRAERIVRKLEKHQKADG